MSIGNMDWDSFVLSLVTVFYGLFLRSSVSLNSYSGAGKPPMFGDYEAQRHWMEITYNLPTAEWYWQTESNDLMYWGLDYPPLTAYHSKLCGIIANFLNPRWVALNVSRGFESYHHKVFMRYTVLFVDLLIYIPSILYFYSVTLKTATKTKKFFMSALVLTYPGLILIDHGHFQYNCVSLGFTCFAVVALLKDRYELGASIFVLALNYKQMELYHALPFFFYLLGICFHQFLWINKVLKLASIGLTVVVTFILCWMPFLTSRHSILQVLHRLFPFNRGLYEDKVANFWCSLSVIYKMKNVFDQQQILKICLISTLLACIPSSLNLLCYPTKKKFLYSMVNCSLAFFLFSFQVHEKSILIIALPVCLLLLDCPLVSVWFLVISTISMYPLLERDGQSFSYFTLLILFIAISLCTMDYSEYHILVKLIVGSSFFGAFILHLLPIFIEAPKKLPDLYALLFSVYCCMHFLIMLVYFNYKQWKCSENDVSADNLFISKKIKNN
ncbi:dolichyl pyrophosphate Man9GlcNAc2 alpha-1,3-glucosyltransferase isoform X2 [Hydra vulgaris]|nr:dolichyl pyrophosphate Man9GlcNAc2 alpha-1,3-glucosyltransferase isoform X1 [Hydra vulgaris]